ncbi:hypothetical protein TWF970_000274 [Orbilia oligospora]|uniref:Peptidase A1 domain-containing protein n=1 Tax=Orbilia oligospora TaxID=2813651 RepID=A0A7C8RL21_ORBOL|nr:hypothetical protein TWF970_000274 [Orbilia oligospora]
MCDILDKYGIYNQFLPNTSGVSISNATVGGYSSSSYISGVPALGRFGLGSLQIEEFTFLAAETYSEIPELGLGGRSLNSIVLGQDSVIPRFGLLAAIWRQELIEVMGLGLSYDAYVSSDLNLSQITLGAVNTQKYDPPMRTYTWPNRDGVGELATRKVTLSTGNISSLSLTNQSTVIILEEPNILVPRIYRDSLLKAMDAYEGSTGNFYVDCNAAENLDFSLNFEFDGINITLTAKDLIGKVQEANEPQCRVFLGSSESPAKLYSRASATLFLGIPFLRVAYVWLDYQNNQTSLAKARQRVTTNSYVKINKDGIVATLGEQNDTPPEMEEPYLPSDNNKTETNKSPVAAIVGGSVGGIIVLGIIVCLIFWKRKRDIPRLQPPDPPIGELEGYQRYEMAAPQGRFELVGSEVYPKELPADRGPVELPVRRAPTEFVERMNDPDNRDS